MFTPSPRAFTHKHIGPVPSRDSFAIHQPLTHTPADPMGCTASRAAPVAGVPEGAADDDSPFYVGTSRDHLLVAITSAAAMSREAAQVVEREEAEVASTCEAVRGAQRRRHRDAAAVAPAANPAATAPLSQGAARAPQIHRVCRTAAPTTFRSIPLSVLLRDILPCLFIHANYVTLSRVCRRWSAAVKHPSLWHDLTLTHFPRAKESHTSMQAFFTDVERVASLRGVRRVDLCGAPLSRKTLEAVAAACGKHLKVLSAWQCVEASPDVHDILYLLSNDDSDAGSASLRGEDEVPVASEDNIATVAAARAAAHSEADRITGAAAAASAPRGGPAAVPRPAPTPSTLGVFCKANFPALEELCLTDCTPAVTDALMYGVTPNLKRIDLNGANLLGDAGLRSIGHGGPLLNLAELDVFGCHKLTSPALAHMIERSPALTDLDVGLCTRLTDLFLQLVRPQLDITSGAGARAGAPLPLPTAYDPEPRLPRLGLTRLRLGGCIRISNEGLRVIGQRCPQLEHLDIAMCIRVTDAGVAAIASGCTGLTSLHIRHVHNITDRALTALSCRCPKLKTLDAAHCSRIGNTGVRHITKRCTKLEVLILSELKLRWMVRAHHGRSSSLTYATHGSLSPPSRACSESDSRLHCSRRHSGAFDCQGRQASTPS